MLNIVIPMAGRGSRFANAGYIEPKPLISVGGKPMIQWIIENVRPIRPHRFIFLCLAEHLEAFPKVPATLRQLCPGCEIVPVDRVTEGAACTVLLAKSLIDNDDPLMIANADQFVRLDINSYLHEIDAEAVDGLIMTFHSDHSKWSYCRMGANGLVQEVVEKKVISNHATVGIYNFRRGIDFVRSAETMIYRNIRVNNEFYVAPAYNQIIAEGGKIIIASTGREYDGMFGLGVPEDLEFFKTTPYFREEFEHADRRPSVTSELCVKLSEIFIKFVDDQNSAGLEAMLCDEIILEAPAILRAEGKTQVIDHLREMRKNQEPGRSAVRAVVVADGMSVVEFSSRPGEGDRRGAYTLRWSGNKVAELHLYFQ